MYTVLLQYVCGCAHPPLVLTGCREKPRPVFLTEVDDLERKHVTGRGFLCCSHHSVEEDKCVTLRSIKTTFWSLNISLLQI